MAGDDVDASFRDDGVVVLRSAFSADDAAFLRDQVWHHIETTTTVRRDDAATWNSDGNFALRAVEQRSIWSAVHSSSPALDALDAIFGVEGWAPPGPPQILLSFPTEGPWEMPGGWHVDFGTDRPTWPVPAVKMFALLDTVEPAGGGTLLLCGSHRLVERLAEMNGGPVDPWDDASRPLESDPYLRRLLAGGDDRALIDAPAEAHGVPLRPVEISGEPGDVVLTHMQVFHSPAPNTSTRPRQMLGNAIRRR